MIRSYDSNPTAEQPADQGEIQNAKKYILTTEGVLVEGLGLNAQPMERPALNEPDLLVGIRFTYFLWRGLKQSLPSQTGHRLLQ